MSLLFILIKHENKVKAHTSFQSFKVSLRTNKFKMSNQKSKALRLIVVNILTL